jgi:predicted metal-dependent hydrolase
MPQRTVLISDIGEVTLAKRRGARNMRLTVTPSGRVRVGLPTWAPYASGVNFAKSHSAWIKAQLAKHRQDLFQDGDLIGKYHRIEYEFSPYASSTYVRLKNPKISVRSRLPLEHPSVQAAIVKAGERALRSEADNLLPQRLKLLAGRHGFNYKSLQIRKLTSRWGSCSNAKDIRLSYFLIQLPWPLIDYVLLHELVHTKHLSHSREFWSAFSSALPDARKLQKQIRAYNPRLLNTKAVA